MRNVVAMRSSVLTMILMVLTLSGCAVGPDYIRPTVEIPSAYKEAVDWKQAEPAGEKAHGLWWNVFGDDYLNNLEEQVNISNQNIKMAEAQYRQAVAVLQIARAGYFPVVTTNPSYTRALRVTAQSQGQSTGTRNQRQSAASQGQSQSKVSSVGNVFSLPVSLSWEIDVWGRIRRAVESDMANAEASAADLEGARLSAQSTLAQTYFQLRTTDAQIRLLGDTAEAYRQGLRLTQNRYNQGIANRADVLQAETQLKTTEAQLLDLTIQRAHFEHVIAILIGKPPASFNLSAVTYRLVPPSVPAGIPSQLLEHRPDISAAERQVAAANAQIGVAKAAFFPKIMLNGSAGYESTALNTLLTWPSHLWSLGSSASQTLFAGGSLKALTDETRAAYDNTVASYRQTVLTAFQQVEDSLVDARVLENEGSIQNSAVAAANEALQVILNQYRAGLV